MRVQRRPKKKQLVDPFRQPIEAHTKVTKPNLVITVATGSEFHQILSLTTESHRRYAEQCDADYVTLTNTTQDWPLNEKFRVWYFANTWERTLFIDADCVIRRDCPNLFETVPQGTIALHDDTPYNRDHLWMIPKWDRVMQSQGVHRPFPNPVLTLNSGVVLCDQTTADYWRPPLKGLPGAHEDEQIWAQSNIQEYGLKLFLLPRQFHNQSYFADFTEFMPRAYIQHFANSTYLFSEPRTVRIQNYLDQQGQGRD